MAIKAGEKGKVSLAYATDHANAKLDWYVHSLGHKDKPKHELEKNTVFADSRTGHENGWKIKLDPTPDPDHKVDDKTRVTAEVSEDVPSGSYKITYVDKVSSPHELYTGYVQIIGKSWCYKNPHKLKQRCKNADPDKERPCVNVHPNL